MPIKALNFDYFVKITDMILNNISTYKCIVTKLLNLVRSAHIIEVCMYCNFKSRVPAVRIIPRPESQSHVRLDFYVHIYHRFHISLYFTALNPILHCTALHCTVVNPTLTVAIVAMYFRHLNASHAKTCNAP
jgi:hypothetical protein